MKRSSGFTLIEVLLVLTIISIFMGVGYTVIPGIKDSARLERTIKESRMILAYAEMIRQKSGGLTIGASPPVYVHSRITLPPGFISLSAMETILGYDTGLSQSNPFGNIYDVEILTHYSRVRTLVPNQVTPVEAQSSTPSGGNTILTFVYNGSARDRLLRAGVDSFKKHFYLEDIR